MITVVSGGVGAARFLRGLLQVDPADEITAVVNVGDDRGLHGLHISPDLDTITYTLRRRHRPRHAAGASTARRGRRWRARCAATAAISAGSTSATVTSAPTSTGPSASPREPRSSEVTAEIVAAWDLGMPSAAGHRRPAADEGHRGRRPADGDLTAPVEVGFQEYFVQRQHAVPVTAVRFDGADAAAPAPGVLDADRRCRRRRDRPVEPDRVDRSGAGRARRARRGRRPPRSRRGRVADRRRRRPEGPCRPAAGRARPRVVGGRRRPALRARSRRCS